MSRGRGAGRGEISGGISVVGPDVRLEGKKGQEGKNSLEEKGGTLGGT